VASTPWLSSIFGLSSTPHLGTAHRGCTTQKCTAKLFVPPAQAFAAANNWFWNFIVARFTPQMFDTMDYGVYFFFASLMICSVIFVYFLLPETKGVPLEAMDRLFSRSLPARKAHKIVLAELRMDDEQFRRERTSAAKVDESGYVIDENHVEKV
jgi:hypothetical protein